MNTCDTCKHWTLGSHPRVQLGDCDSDKWLRGYHVPDEDIEPSSVHVEDDEGWAFQTGPKFGCIHWQSRSE